MSLLLFLLAVAAVLSSSSATGVPSGGDSLQRCDIRRGITPKSKWLLAPIPRGGGRQGSTMGRGRDVLNDSGEASAEEGDDDDSGDDEPVRRKTATGGRKGGINSRNQYYDDDEDGDDDDDEGGYSSAELSEDDHGGKNTGLTSKALHGIGKMASGSVKGAFKVLQPKAVTLEDVTGCAWKLEQTMNVPSAGSRSGRGSKSKHTGGQEVVSIATIELRRDGTVMTHYEGQEKMTDFVFRAHSWPRSCMIEFDAWAWQGPRDPEPVLKRYKGYFTRSLMDSSVVMMEGNIYEIQGKMLWKKTVKTGKFTARRRPLPPRSQQTLRQVASEKRGIPPLRKPGPPPPCGGLQTGRGGPPRQHATTGGRSGSGGASRRTLAAVDNKKNLVMQDTVSDDDDEYDEYSEETEAEDESQEDKDEIEDQDSYDDETDEEDDE